MAKNTLAVRMTLNAQEFTRNLNKIKRQLNNAFGKDAIQGSEALFGKLKYFGVGIVALGAKAVSPLMFMWCERNLCRNPIS